MMSGDLCWLSFPLSVFGAVCGAIALALAIRGRRRLNAAIDESTRRIIRITSSVREREH